MQSINVPFPPNLRGAKNDVEVDVHIFCTAGLWGVARRTP